jgi:hypothetical protein
MIGLDLLTNRDEILRWFVSDPAALSSINSWVDIIEDIIKVIGEGIFLGAFYCCYDITRRDTERCKKDIK